MSTCNGCGAEVRWIKTVAGKAMICDPDPIVLKPDDAHRTTIVTEDGRTIRGFTTPTMRATDEGVVVGYSPHWWTCPASSSFKKKRGKKE